MTDQTPVTDDDRKAHKWASHYGGGPLDPVARAIRAHVPAPQIIRTPADLEALDPETLLSTMSGDDTGGLARTAQHILICYGTALRHNPDQWPLPAVVVASGEHIRACREALEGETGKASGG